MKVMIKKTRHDIKSVCNVMLRKRLSAYSRRVNVVRADTSSLAVKQ
jgi:hypothetical protein